MRPTESFEDLSASYRWFADEAAPTSPVWAELCRWIAVTLDVLRRLEPFRGQARRPNLFLGALRYLDAPSQGGPELLVWLERRWPEVERVLVTRSTQTNEAGRCAVLAPVLASLPGPLYLIEVGASAGLCLYPDRYGYRYSVGSASIAVGDQGTCQIDCAVAGAGLPPGVPVIGERIGIDLNPLDAGDADTVAWLAALVWPGEEEREARLRRCCSAVAGWRPQLQRGDALQALPALLENVPSPMTPVVLHSAVLAYLGPQERADFAAMVSAAPAHWVSLEGAGVIDQVARRLPQDRPAAPHFVLALDGEPLAFAGQHGSWIQWL